MKWSFVIQQKVKASLLLGGIMVVILLSALVSRMSLDNIDHSLSSIYQDRLVPTVDIVYLSEHLYSKRLLLEQGLEKNAATSWQELGKQLSAHTHKIDSLLVEFQKTKLVEEEVKALNALKTHAQAYATLEQKIVRLAAHSASQEGKELFQSEGSQLFQKSIHRLSELTKIQSVVGQKLIKDSHTETYYCNLLSNLQIIITIIIGTIVVSLVVNSKIIRQDSQPFHLN